jgi:hypothetical protein
VTILGCVTGGGGAGGGANLLRDHECAFFNPYAIENRYWHMLFLARDWLCAAQNKPITGSFPLFAQKIYLIKSISFTSLPFPCTDKAIPIPISDNLIRG